MSGTLLLGIDIGTSSSKGVLCTPDGEIVASATIGHDTSFPRPGWAEHDADVIWWGEFVGLCRKLLDGSHGGDDVAGVAISAIGPCMLPVDEAGAPLRPAVLYGIDSRASAEIDSLVAQAGEEELFALGGMALSSQAIGPKILWLRNHEPELFARTAMIHSSSDYVVFRLTGEHVIDRHTAAAFNPLFNIHRLEWDDRYADLIIERDRLPRVLETGDVAGTVTPAASEATGLRIGTPVTAGTIDVAAESLSVGITDPGDMMLMYGSTMFMLNLVDKLRPDKRLWTATHSLPGIRTMMGGMATSGLITKWFRDELAGEERHIEQATGRSAFQQLFEQAQQIDAGSNGLICLPYFAGERTPLHDPLARGMFAGLNLLHTRGHLFRAVLEGTGYAVRHHLEIMDELGAMPSRVVAVGGGTQNDLWMQVISDITGLRQHVPARTIGAAYGDAFLAGLASGLVESVDALHQNWVQIDRTIDPIPAHRDIHDEGYAIYRNLYEHTSDDVHRLARMDGA